MRNIVYLILFLLFFACDSEDAPSCFKKAGDAITIEIAAEEFNSLEINDQFNVIIEEGSNQKIFLDYFDNLIGDVEYEVKEGLFVIRDNNSCSWVRDYNFPVLRITHPNITDIRQNGGGLITNLGVLHYDRINLISERRSGDFDLTIDNETLYIVNNDLSNYYIKGKTNELIIVFASGNGRFEGENLVTQSTHIFHRASNDMVVNTQNSLTGRILGTGNVIFVGSKPPTIDISIENRGKLIDRTN